MYSKDFFATFAPHNIPILGDNGEFLTFSPHLLRSHERPRILSPERCLTKATFTWHWTNFRSVLLGIFNFILLRWFLMNGTRTVESNLQKVQNRTKSCLQKRVASKCTFFWDSRFYGRRASVGRIPYWAVMPNLFLTQKALSNRKVWLVIRKIFRLLRRFELSYECWKGKLKCEKG